MNKKTLKVIAGLIILFFAVLGIRFAISKQPVPLQVISVSPEGNSESISVSQEITINFNKELNKMSEISFSINPDIANIPTLTNENKSIVIKHDGPFHSGTSYTIIVSNQKKQTLWQSTFTTESLQGDPAIPYESARNTEINYPLLKETPHVTKNISVIYKGPLTLEVTLIKGTKEEAIAEIEKWLESKGVNPSTHKIEWYAPTPEPSPAL